MALPTMAQWTDAWAQVTVYPELGQLYADSAHIFRAMGIPDRVNKGVIRVNWTDGAGAGSVGTGAGAPTSGSAAPAQVDDTFNLDFSAIASQAYTDIGIEMMGGGFEDQLSLQKATSAIYDEWVNQLLGSAAGVDYAVWGAEHFFAEAAPIAAGMIDKTGGTAANLMDFIDYAIAKLPSSGYNVCITDIQGYNLLKKRLRLLGGVDFQQTSAAEFGFQALMYSGCIFFHSRHQATKASSPSGDSPFYFFNIGPEGCRSVIPGTEDPFVVLPGRDVGYFNTVWDIALKTQFIYTSPRAAYQLWTAVK